MNVPSLLRDNLIGLHGREMANRWFQDLPMLIRTVGEKWSITVAPPFPNLTYHYVAPAVGVDDKHYVVKLSIPSTQQLHEVTALQLFKRNSVRLVDVDLSLGASLLERITPGTPLSQHISLENDDLATDIAVELLQGLWTIPPTTDSLPSVDNLFDGFVRLRERFDGSTGPLPSRLVEKAERLHRELSDSCRETILLHGDFHHGNILLRDDNRWLAIDPHGVIGERACEISSYLRNPSPELFKVGNIKHIMARRVDQFSEGLGLDRQRIVGWGFSMAVLSAWWSIEDGGVDWDHSIICAESLDSLT